MRMRDPEGVGIGRRVGTSRETEGWEVSLRGGGGWRLTGLHFHVSWTASAAVMAEADADYITVDIESISIAGDVPLDRPRRVSQVRLLGSFRIFLVLASVDGLFRVFESEWPVALLARQDGGCVLAGVALAHAWHLGHVGDAVAVGVTSGYEKLRRVLGDNLFVNDIGDL